MSNTISSVRVFFNETSKTLNIVIPNATEKDVANAKKFLSATIENITGITDNGIETDEVLAIKSEVIEQNIVDKKDSPPSDAEIARNPIPEDDNINLGLLSAKAPETKIDAPISNDIEAPVAKEKTTVDDDVYKFNFGQHEGKKIIDFVNASNATVAYNYLAFILEKNFKKVAEKRSEIIQNINIATKKLFDEGFVPNEKCTFEMAKTFLYCLSAEKVEQLLALEGYGSIQEAINAMNNEWFSQIVSTYVATI